MRIPFTCTQRTQHYAMCVSVLNCTCLCMRAINDSNAGTMTKPAFFYASLRSVYSMALQLQRQDESYEPYEANTCFYNKKNSGKGDHF